MTTLEEAPVRRADVAGSRPEPARRTGRWFGFAGFAALAYVPLLLTDPGKVDADTKSYLYLDPGRVLERAVSMWDPHIGLGTVTHQNIGYLFPMGPFYWVLEQLLGVPPWVAQRLWLGTLVLAAGLGTRYLLRVLGVRGPGVPVAVLAYAFTPYVLEFSARLSVLLGPWAALPWMIGFVVLALRRGGWKYPALFAITVQLVGGVNATALIYAGIGPVLWFPYAVWIAKEVPFRRALAAFGRVALLTLLTSLWWIVGLWSQSGYGLDILRFTESIQTVSATSYPNEVLRGLGYWFFYGRDRIGLWNPAMLEFTQKPWLIFVSYLLPALAMLAAGSVRWRHRAYFVLLALVGVVIAVAASPYEDPSILGGVFKDFATTSTAGLALRSTARATPLIVLGFAVLLAVGISALSTALTRRGLRWGGVGAAVLVGVVAVANAPGIWGGAYYSKYLERSDPVPAYWTQALAYVDGRPHDTRVLALPGSDFAAYRWGDTIDPIEPGLIDRPYVARELVPWGSAASADLLRSLDVRIQDQALDPSALAPVARLMGVGDVLLRMDLQTDRFGLVPADELWRLVSPDTPDGLDPARVFGTKIPGRLQFPDPGDVSRVDRPGETSAPAVAVLGVKDPIPIVRTKSGAAPLVVDGDSEGLIDISSVGLLDPTRLVLLSGAYADDAATLRRRVTDGATLVVTDTNRRRGERWASMRDNFGYTEQAGEQPMQEDPLDQRLSALSDAGDAARTVAEFDGVASVQATSFGNPYFGYSAAERPAAALDGDSNTAWTVAGGLPRVPQERIRVVLERPVTADRINLSQIIGGTQGRWITQVDLSFDGGRTLRRSLGKASRTRAGQLVEFPRRTFTSFEIRISGTRANRVGPKASASGRARKSAVGFSEIRLQDDQGRTIHAGERIRLPDDLLRATGRSSLEHPLVLVMSRIENEVHRSFTLPTDRDFGVDIGARLLPGSDGTTLDELLGIPGLADGQPIAVAPRYLGTIASRGSSAIDGDPATAWNTPYDKVRNRTIEVRTPAPVTFDHLDLQLVADGRHSVPTQLRLTTGDGTERVVDLPAVTDQAQRGATVTVPVSFEPVTGTSFTFRLTAVRPVTIRDAASDSRIAFPAAIAELGIPGVRRAPMPAQLPGTCRDDLVTVDGKPYPVRLVGSTADAVDHRTLSAQPCAGSDLSLARGEHRIDARMTKQTGISFDRVVLSSAAGGAATPLATLQAPKPGGSTPAADPRKAGAGPRVRVVHQSATKIEARVDGADAPFWMVLGQSLNTGWHARAGGHDLGAPQLVDGFANGWLVKPGTGTVEITMEWTPQRAVDAGLAVSAVSLLACAGIAVVASLRRRRVAFGDAAADAELPPLSIPRLADPRRVRGHRPSPVAAALTPLLSGVAAGVVVRPWVGVLVAALVLLTVVRPRTRVLLSLAPGALLLLGGLYVAAGQFRHDYAPQFDWVTFFSAMRTVGWLAIVLLAADAVVGLVRRAEPDPQDEPEVRVVSAGDGGQAAATRPEPDEPDEFATPLPRPGARGVLLTIAILGVLGVVLPLLTASHYGAFGVPRSDDWSYMLTLFRWIDDGRLALNDWVSMTLVGQLVLAAPVALVTGNSVAAMDVWSAVVGFVGLLALVWLGRDLLRPGWWALLLAVTIAVGPLWGPLATTYMTDVPAFSLEMLALALGCVALGRRPVDMRWLAAALAAGFVGISIRQYGAIPVIALVVAAAVTLLAAQDRRRLRILVLATLAVAVASAALLVWWSSLPDSKSLTPTSATGYTVRHAVVEGLGFLRLTGLLLVPAVVVAGPVRVMRRAWRLAPGITALVSGAASFALAVTYAIDPHTPFVGNYVARQGVLADDVLTGRRPNVIPSSLFDLVALAGSLAAVVIVTAAVPFLAELGARWRARRWAPEDPRVLLLGLTVAGFVVVYSAAIVTGLPIFDRYALPAIPVVALLFLRSVRRRDALDAPARTRARAGRVPSWAPTAVALVLLAALGFAYSADSASYDGTRWKVSTLATRRGYDVLNVDGGFEWISWHRKQGPITKATPAERRVERQRYFRGLCVTVVIDPRHVNPDVVVARARSTAPGRAPVWIYALKNSRSCAIPKR